jgi:hypothetical protein
MAKILQQKIMDKSFAIPKASKQPPSLLDIFGVGLRRKEEEQLRVRTNSAESIMA